MAAYHRVDAFVLELRCVAILGEDVEVEEVRSGDGFEGVTFSKEFARIHPVVESSEDIWIFVLQSAFAFFGDVHDEAMEIV